MWPDNHQQHQKDSCGDDDARAWLMDIHRLFTRFPDLRPFEAISLRLSLRSLRLTGKKDFALSYHLLLYRNLVTVIQVLPPSVDRALSRLKAFSDMPR